MTALSQTESPVAMRSPPRRPVVRAGAATDGLKPLLPKLPARERRSLAGGVATAVVSRVPHAPDDARERLPGVRRHPTLRRTPRTTRAQAADRLLAPDRRSGRLARSSLPARPDHRHASRTRAGRADRSPGRDARDPRPGRQRSATRSSWSTGSSTCSSSPHAIGLDLRAIDRDRRNMQSILAGPLAEAHRALSDPHGPLMRAIATNDPARTPAALPRPGTESPPRWRRSCSSIATSGWASPNVCAIGA